MVLDSVGLKAPAVMRMPIVVNAIRNKEDAIITKYGNEKPEELSVISTAHVPLNPSQGHILNTHS
jgi:hypothetical protein